MFLFRCYLFAAAVAIGLSGSVCAETFLATIAKVEGGKVTFMRTTQHEGKAGMEKYTHDKSETVEVAKDVAVTRGHFLPGPGETTTEGRVTGKLTPLKDGLDDKLVKNINAGKSTRPCLVTIGDKGDDKGKITAINFWSSAAPK